MSKDRAAELKDAYAARTRAWCVFEAAKRTCQNRDEDPDNDPMVLDAYGRSLRADEVYKKLDTPNLPALSLPVSLHAPQLALAAMSNDRDRAEEFTDTYAEMMQAWKVFEDIKIACRQSGQRTRDDPLAWAALARVMRADDAYKQMARPEMPELSLPAAMGGLHIDATTPRRSNSPVTLDDILCPEEAYDDTRGKRKNDDDAKHGASQRPRGNGASSAGAGAGAGAAAPPQSVVSGTRLLTIKGKFNLLPLAYELIAAVETGRQPDNLDADAFFQDIVDAAEVLYVRPGHEQHPEMTRRFIRDIFMKVFQEELAEYQLMFQHGHEPIHEERQLMLASAHRRLEELCEQRKAQFEYSCGMKADTQMKRRHDDDEDKEPDSPVLYDPRRRHTRERMGADSAAGAGGAMPVAVIENGPEPGRPNFEPMASFITSCVFAGIFPEETYFYEMPVRAIGEIFHHDMPDGNHQPQQNEEEGTTLFQEIARAIYQHFRGELITSRGGAGPAAERYEAPSAATRKALNVRILAMLKRVYRASTDDFRATVLQ